MQVYISLINCNDFMRCIHMQDVCAYICVFMPAKKIYVACKEGDICESDVILLKREFQPYEKCL